MNEDNYFQILELDPDTSDEALIKQRLLEKQRLWSRQAVEGTPKSARLAGRNLKLLEQMRETLLDPKKRADMAHKAKLQKTRRERELRMRLSALLEFARGKVTHLEQFINKDCAPYVRELGREEVLRLVEAAGITEREAKGQLAGTIQRQTLEITTAKRIREALEHIGKRDLYDFLGLSRRCSAERLVEKAESVNKALLQSGRIDDQVSAAKELVGHAMAVLSTEEGKTRYNNTLVADRLDAVLGDFLLLAGQDGVIDQSEFQELLTIAAKNGLSADDTTAHIHATAKRRKWMIHANDTLAVTQALLPCGYCGCVPKDAEASFCWHCNKSLTLDCPQCGKSVHSSQLVCTDCGANIEDMELVEADLQKAQLALQAGQLDTSLQHLEACLSVWSTWKPAIQLREQVLEYHAKHQSLSRNLMKHLRERRMFEAQECLSAWEKIAVTATGDESPMARASELVHRSIAEANRLFDEGEQHRRAGNLAEAGQCYEQALALCADMKAAQEALRHVPPQAPENLQLVVQDHALVHLVWAAPSSGAQCDYVLVRKAHSVATHPEDGEVLATGKTTRFDDSTASPAVPWYYTVFSVRHKVPSAIGVTAGPVTLAPPVREFTALPGDGVVTLSWKIPEGSTGTQVTRQEQDGSNTTLAVTGNHAMDSGLVNGTAYTYTAKALYAAPTSPSGAIASSEALCHASPVQPFEAVQKIIVSQQEQKLVLSWLPPSQGTVCLLQIKDTARILDSGTTMRVEDLAGYGEPLALSSVNTAIITLKSDAPVWQKTLVPITMVGNLAAWGEACFVTELRPVEAVEDLVHQGQPMVRWQWPQGVQEILVRWNTQDVAKGKAGSDAYPSTPTSPCSGQLICRLEDYTRDGGLFLSGITPQRLCMTLFAKAQGQEGYSSGVHYCTHMGLVDVVHYEVLRTGWGKKSTAVALYSEHVDALDNLVLRGKEGCVPLSLQDGIIIAHIEHIRFYNGVATIDIPRRFQKSRLYIKLFHTNPERYATIRLMPAGIDLLKLS